MRSKDEIFDEIKQIIVELIDEKDTEIKEETLLIDDLKLNSITLIQLVVNIEEKLNVHFDDEYLLVDKLNSLTDIVDYVSLLSEVGESDE